MVPRRTAIAATCWLGFRFHVVEVAGDEDGGLVVTVKSAPGPMARSCGVVTQSMARGPRTGLCRRRVKADPLARILYGAYVDHGSGVSTRVTADSGIRV